MKTKLLRKLRRMAKKAVVMRASVNVYSEISLKTYRKAESNDVYYKYPTFRYTEKAKAIEHLKFTRRCYILEHIAELREDALNKELSKL